MPKSSTPNRKDDPLFNSQLNMNELNNNRAAVRYVRTDISAAISYKSLFIKSKLKQVQLIDISSKGAAFKCEQSLSIKQKVILNLRFKDKTIFKVSAIIIYKNAKTNRYGIKFDHLNATLGNYLASSLTDLVFK